MHPKGGLWEGKEWEEETEDTGKLSPLVSSWCLGGTHLQGNGAARSLSRATHLVFCYSI